MCGLQGGPGGSSMFGLLKLHGPILTTEDENGNVAATENPYSWHRRHNMIYIDNPVGAGKKQAHRRQFGGRLRKSTNTGGGGAGSGWI